MRVHTGEKPCTCTLALLQGIWRDIWECILWSKFQSCSLKLYHERYALEWLLDKNTIYTKWLLLFSTKCTEESYEIAHNVITPALIQIVWRVLWLFYCSIIWFEDTLNTVNFQRYKEGQDYSSCIPTFSYKIFLSLTQFCSRYWEDGRGKYQERKWHQKCQRWN